MKRMERNILRFIKNIHRKSQLVSDLMREN